MTCFLSSIRPQLTPLDPDISSTADSEVTASTSGWHFAPRQRKSLVVRAFKRDAGRHGSREPNPTPLMSNSRFAIRLYIEGRKLAGVELPSEAVLGESNCFAKEDKGR